MILRKLNFASDSASLINIVFALFPFSFIAGNLIVNINFFIFCCLGIFHLKSKILTNKLNLPLKIVLIFFLLVFFSTSLNFVESLYLSEYEKSDLSKLVKSILFFRFFIFLSIVYFLSKFDIINYKLFFTSASILPILISVDVIFQYIFGFNVIGIQSLSRHNPSIFGDEIIAGGYIQNFSFFSILFLVNLIGKNNNLSKIIIITSAICLLGIGILLSGNRMPAALFLLGLVLLFFFRENLKSATLISCCIIYIFFQFIISFDENMNNHYGSFYQNTKHATVTLSKKMKDNFSLTKQESKKQENFKENLDEDPEKRSQTKIVLTAFETWKTSKIFGNGIKSFRYECKKILAQQKKRLCANHPHNYYIEILTDLGIAGFILALGLASIFIFFLVKKYKVLKKENNLQNLILLAAIISLFLEVFPFKSTGSIFSTNNATYIILMSSIIFSFKKLFEGKNFGTLK